MLRSTGYKHFKFETSSPSLSGYYLYILLYPLTLHLTRRTSHSLQSITLYARTPHFTLPNPLDTRHSNNLRSTPYTLHFPVQAPLLVATFGSPCNTPCQHSTLYRRKFRRNFRHYGELDKSRGGKIQRGEERRKSEKKEVAGARKGRKGLLKRRVRSHLARREMKNCTPLWREARFSIFGS